MYEPTDTSVETRIAGANCASDSSSSSSLTFAEGMELPSLTSPAEADAGLLVARLLALFTSRLDVDDAAALFRATMVFEHVEVECGE